METSMGLPPHSIKMSFIYYQFMLLSILKQRSFPIKALIQKNVPRVNPLRSSSVDFRLSIYLNVRNYSTNSSVGAQQPVKALRAYRNADLQKLQIIKENEGKAGVYRFVNKQNNKSYIGSSSDLGRRFREYFNINYLEREIKKNKSIIYRSLLKKGYSNFTLEILEYCEPSEAVSKEQYYIDLLSPVYNILPTAGSLLGFKHSEETIAKFKGYKHSEENIAKIKAIIWSAKPREKLLEHLKGLHSRKAQMVIVIDTRTNEKTVYPSITEAARAIEYSQAGISMALKRSKERVSRLVNKRYAIFPVNDKLKASGNDFASSAAAELKRS